jgi:hypothetical protein
MCDFRLEGRVALEHLIHLFPFGAQFGHLTFEILDVLSRPLSDRSLGFAVICSFSFQLLYGQRRDLACPGARVSLPSCRLGPRTRVLSTNTGRLGRPVGGTVRVGHQVG